VSRRKDSRQQGHARSYPGSAKELVSRARAHGLEAELRKSGHWALWLPDDDPRAQDLPQGSVGTSSRPLIMAATPSDRRAQRNALAMLARTTGVDLTRPRPRPPKGGGEQ